MNKARLRVNVIECGWKHHLEGAGWRDICARLKNEFGDSRSAIDCFTAYEYQVREKVRKPFIAFFHQVVGNYERSLENIFHSELWMHNKMYFLGGFVFSNFQKNYLKSIRCDRNIHLVVHPTRMNVKRWSFAKYMEKQIFLHVGVHCRNVNFFLNTARRRKNKDKYQMLVARNEDYEMNVASCKQSGVEVVKRLDSTAYQEVLASSVIFINLIDAAANNTILECIARGTPILINAVGGVKEYVGNDYPLLYSDMSHAQHLIGTIKKNPEILKKTHQHLLSLRHKYTNKQFISTIKNALPIMISRI